MALQSRQASSKSHLFIIFIVLIVLFGPLPVQYALNILSERVSTILEERGVFFQQRPRILWSLSPPTIGLADLEFRIQQEPSLLANIRIEKLVYTFESTLLSQRNTTVALDSNDTDSGPFYTRFARISWNNATINVQNPHPQPHFHVEDGRLSLLLATNRTSVFNLLSAKQLSGSKSFLFHLSLSSITISTHSVTSIPITVSHPIITRLETLFPSILNTFTRSPIPDSDGSRIISPPHLSVFAPSLVLPSFYRAILGLKSRVDARIEASQKYRPNFHPWLQSLQQDDRGGGTYSISVQIVDESNMRQCSSVQLLDVNLTEIRGRDEDGRGGCCSLHMHHITSGSLSPNNNQYSDTDSDGRENLVGDRPLTWQSIKTLVLQPGYLISFTLRLIWATRSGPLDPCHLRDIFHYQIDKIEIVDKTPYSNSRVTNVLGFAHQRALNVFEDALSLVL
ncbi:SubName: Full=Uncharacterized protein {ECO:0000313/EMBL:CCA75130.1} [Serendipita indica DSM 11827]|nr:SubName: Full=Uncharacterized protein {ECO:0000313/EMBL:CCA75130.1} [Serendipita indica DSM 11827]